LKHLLMIWLPLLTLYYSSRNYSLRRLNYSLLPALLLVLH